MKIIHAYQKNNFSINRYNYECEARIVLLIIIFLLHTHGHIPRKQSQTLNMVVRGNYGTPELEVVNDIVSAASRPL